MNLVRFAIKTPHLPYVGHWLDDYDRLSERVVASGLPLQEANDHPWHDRDEYAVYDGATDAMLPVLRQIAQELGIRVEYPCVRDIRAFDDGTSKWYGPEVSNA